MSVEASNAANLAENLTAPAGVRELIQALADAALTLHRVANALLGQRDSSAFVPLPHAPPGEGVTLLETVNELLAQKARKGRSDGYLEQLQHCFKEFCKGRATRPLSSFTTQELEAWIEDCGVSARTQKGRIQYLRLLFTFATRRNYLRENPALALELPTQPVQEPGRGIHTPAQVRAVLAAARAISNGTAKALAIRYFAGLRAAEQVRLAPEDIDLERRRIEVRAANAKTRKRRPVAIQPNLAAWLALPGELPSAIEKHVTAAWKAAKVPWPRNAPRHSFCSYHLEHFQSGAKTAIQAGHSEAMLFSTYRDLVSVEAAREYWSIVP